MKQAGWISLLIGLALSLMSCSGGGGSSDDGGRMYSLTCTLGCTNGEGGQQVSCGIVNTFLNQDIAVLFTEPVDLAWIQANANAFQVINTATAITPAGGPLIDPANSKRLIWRPELSFDALGTPSFGFKPGASYQIRVPGTAQGDVGPYVRSTGGKNNESRILCTITTDQGTVDPVPGPPLVEIYVTEIDPVSGLPKPGTRLEDVVGTVSSTSPITFVFKDIMNLGTVVNPSTKLAPFITVKVDDDGNLADPSDQVAHDGTYAFNVNQSTLETTAVYIPSKPYPSAGAGFPANPRRVVINIPSQVIDLVKNPVSNGGISSFVPQVISFGTVVLPTGGEQFTDVGNEDPRRSGADWGQSSPGRLKPGTGGGSGRMGDLVINAGEVVTLYTSKQFARGEFDFQDNPANFDVIWFDDGVNPQEEVKFKNVTDPTKLHVEREDFTSYSLTRAFHALPLYSQPMPPNPNPPLPTPIIDQVDVAVVDSNKLVVTSKVKGTAGEIVMLSAPPGGGGPGNNNATIIATTLTGGVDNNSFGSTGEIGEDQILTNFDFQANPGGDPGSITSISGVFEFAHVDVKPGGTLRIVGVKPAQVLVRGSMNFAAGALIDITGESLGSHASESPLGQLGGIAGPGAGDGGRGAHRQDNTGKDLMLLPTNSANMTYDAGIENPGGSPDGVPGTGVGGQTGNLFGRGEGGTRFPLLMPGTTTNLFGLETDTNCDSEQVGAPGGGGAYATDGGVGVALAANPLSAQGNPNAPVDTAGGAYEAAFLEPPGTTVPGDPRTLSPRAGYLLGGSGGGGGGGNIHDTSTDDAGPDCITAPSAIDIYRSHSGGGGGGGGGVLQIAVGALSTINGVIDASGGDGGGFDATAQVNGTALAPGGGGSGGGILIQAGILDLAFQPGRLLVPGGTGGAGEHGSAGGDGGTGLVRAESLTALTATDIAASVDPVDPLDPTSLDWVSVGTWLSQDRPPESMSGAQSCWMQAAGSVSALNFNSDIDPVIGPFGWNMDMILDTGSGARTHAYRGSTVYGGNSPQAHWGELLNVQGVAPGTAAPVVVRFQGARSTATLADPCMVDPNAPGGEIQTGTVTPWVRHPSELNAYSPRPDLVRFVIIFDESHDDFDDILGVTNLRILSSPD